jgi:hypothetical protein
MRKGLVIFALFLAAMPPMPGQTTKPSAQSANNANSQSQSSQNTPAKSPTVIGANKQAVSSNNGHEEPAADDREHSVKLTSLPPVTLADKHKTFWDYFLDWGPWAFGLVTAIAAGLQIWLLFRTWEAINRQANLQKLITKQWVDVGNWSIGGDEPWEIGPGFKKTDTLKQSMSMGISFHILNPTLYPLTIERIVVFVGKRKQFKWKWKTFHDSRELILPPSSPSGENAEVYTIPIRLEGDEVWRYTKSGFYLRMHVRIIYSGSEGEATRQDFPMDITFKEKAQPVFARYSDRRVKEVAEGEQHEPQNPD